MALSTNAGRQLHEVELRAATLTFLLTVYWAGRPFRWATEAIDIESDEGTLHFDPMTEFEELEQFFNLETDSPGLLSASFRRIIFPQEVDVALLSEQGHDLSAATGELAVVVVGQNWEDRYVILDGELTEPTYADPDEVENSVGFTLENQLFDDTAVFPPTANVVSVNNFPDAIDDDKGLVFPFVFGIPGQWRDLTRNVTTNTANLKSSPALRIEDGAGTPSDIMIAGHQIVPAMLLSATVRVFDETLGATDIFTPSEATNLFTGQKYTVVDLTGGFSGAGYTVGNVYWVQLWGAALDRGAFPALDWDGPMSGAGDMLLYMLDQSSLEVDIARTASARQFLNRYRVGGYIDTSVSPYTWITDNLAPLLPISFFTGPSGIYPVVWLFDATAKDVIAEVSVGPDWRRTSEVDRDEDNIVNEFKLEFASDEGSYRRSITLTGEIRDYDRDGAGDTDYDRQPDFYARLSRERFGKTFADGLTSDIVWENETAQAVASWKIRANALPKRRVQYQASVRWSWLEPGSVISVTDPDLHWVDRVVLVESRAWTLTGPTFGILVIEDPARDPRPFA